MVYRCKISGLIFLFLLVFALSPDTQALKPQEVPVNQKKINKAREKRAKENRAQYEKALKQHYDNQSKETKKMIKKANRESKKRLPVK